MSNNDSHYGRRGILIAGASVSALAFAATRGLTSQGSESSGEGVVTFRTAAPVTAAATTPVTGDYALLRARHARMLTGGSDLPTGAPYTGFIAALDSKVAEYLSTLNEASGRTYLWNDQTSGTGSANMTQSFVRLRAMAIQYATPGSTYNGSSSLLSKTISGLQWLSDNKYISGAARADNWWDWDIGSPQAALDAVILLYGTLSSTLRNALMSAVDYFVSGSAHRTAANLAWLTRCGMLHAIVVENTTKFTSAQTTLLSMMANVTSGDGFYDDGSFIQHNTHPYTGGYGVAVLFHLSWLVHLIGGSSPNLIDPSDWAKMIEWVWESFDPLLFRGAISGATLGRNVARSTSTDHSTGAAILACAMLMQSVASSSDSADLKGLVKAHVLADTARDFFTYDPITGIGSLTMYVIRLGWGIRNDSALTARAEVKATTIFPRMDRISHRAPGWMMNIAMFSARTANFESINGENLHGWYTANGMVYFYNGTDLDHYQDDFWPTVDPYRLPGTTIDKRARANGVAQSSVGKATSLVGGVSDQNCGVGVMTVDRDGGEMLARKSYIIIGDYIIFQGSGITNSSTNAVETIVENRNIGASGTNQVLMNTTSNSVLTTMGTTETLAANWIHIEGLGGYIFRGGNTTLKGLRSTRSGRWTDINSDSRTPTDLRTRRYLTFWFDHGVQPSNGTYGYIFMPGFTASTVGSAYTNNQVRYLAKQNSHLGYAEFSTIQVYGAAFWAADVNGIFQASAPCTVIVRVTNGRMAITLSDPLQTQTSPITVTVALPSSSVIFTSSSITASRTATSATVTFSPSNMKGRSGQAVFQL